MTIRLTAVGTPRPQGSKRALPNGRVIEMSRGLAEWRRAVADSARAWLAAHPQQPLAEPVRLSVEFRFPTVKSAPDRHFHQTAPDCSKLIRGVEDALVDGGLLADDRFIVQIDALKRYVNVGGEAVGATLIIESVAGEEAKWAAARREFRKAPA